MNFKNIFILPNVIGDRSRRRFGGIFIKIPKVTLARSSLMLGLCSPKFVPFLVFLSHKQDNNTKKLFRQRRLQ